MTEARLAELAATWNVISSLPLGDCHRPAYQLI